MSDFFDSLTTGMIFILDGKQYEVDNIFLSLETGDCKILVRDGETGKIFLLNHLTTAYKEGRIKILGHGSLEVT